MAEPRRREARTDLPGAAVGAPAPTTTPDSVTLSDGRVVTLRRLNGLDSSLLEQAMEDAGFTHLSGPGQGTYLRCSALCAIKEIGGQLQTPPTTGAELRGRLAGFLEEDWGTLVQGYLRLSGMLPPSAPKEGLAAAPSVFRP